LDKFKGFKGFYVYLLWGDDGPIYIGQSARLHTRLCQHMADPRKRALTRRIEVIECANYQQVCDAEKRLIIEHKPPLNTTFVRALTIRVKTKPFPTPVEPLRVDDVVYVPASLYESMRRARRGLREIVS
jgi:predicted GIY-YIG superfamily endonuclease